MPAKEACPSLPAGCGRDGRRRMAALVNSRAAARLLGSASLRGDAVGRRGASSHADLFWARMRDESGRAEGARVCARRRGAREHRRVIGGSRQAPEYTLHAATTARPTAGRFRSIPRDPHAMEAGAARLRGRPHRMLRARVVLDRAATWTRLGVRVARDRRPRGQRRGWRE
jgi:hypothetical protein